MIQRFFKVGLCLVVASIVVSGSDAEARYRCRNRGRCSNGGYANTWGNGGYTNNCGASNNCGTSACGVGGCSAASGCQSGCQAAVTTMNGQIIQSNATAPVDTTYSVGKPVYSDQNPQGINQPAATQLAPAPAVIDNGTLPQVQNSNPPVKNSSPDPDNEGRNASKIPGTAPTNAPAPAANATP